MLNVESRGLLNRFTAGLAGLAMISYGVITFLRNGDFFYANYFGGLVFTPLAVLAGIFTIFCAIFKPEWLGAKPAQHGSRRHRRKH